MNNEKNKSNPGFTHKRPEAIDHKNPPVRVAKPEAAPAPQPTPPDLAAPKAAPKAAK